MVCIVEPRGTAPSQLQVIKLTGGSEVHSLCLTLRRVRYLDTPVTYHQNVGKMLKLVPALTVLVYNMCLQMCKQQWTDVQND